MSFNKQSTCIGYKAMKELKKDLAKSTFLQSWECHVSLPSLWQKLFQISSN